jgi:hypothetical protein
MFEPRKKTKAPNGAPKEDRTQAPRPARAPAAKPHRPHSRNLS